MGATGSDCEELVPSMQGNDVIGSPLLEPDVPVLFPAVPAPKAQSRDRILAGCSTGSQMSTMIEPLSLSDPSTVQAFASDEGYPRERDSKTTSATTEVQWNYERLARRAGPSGACVFVYISDRTVSSYAGENVPPPLPISATASR